MRHLCNLKIISAHCNCMAGLGESCSHIASGLFFIDAYVQRVNSRTVTDIKSYWVEPSKKHLDLMKGQEISSTSFTNPHSGKWTVEGTNTKNNEDVDFRVSRYLPPTSNDLNDFFQALTLSNTKPAILSIVEPYSISCP